MGKEKISKAEKRKQKEEEKKKNFEQMRVKTLEKLTHRPKDKKPKFAESPKENNTPLIAKDPTENKSPKNQINPNEYKSMYVDFNLNKKDIEDNWSWGLARIKLEDDYESIIKPFLERTREIKWGDIEAETYTPSTRGSTSKTKHHHNYITALEEEIKIRWLELELEHDQVFTFRIDGKKRLWGFRTINSFSLIWWDPKHEIYYGKKYTPKLKYSKKSI